MKKIKSIITLCIIVVSFTSCTLIKDVTNKSLEVAKGMGEVIQKSFADDDSTVGKMARKSGESAVEVATYTENRNQ